ncbi:Gldg family protein [Flavobacteriaceae bacterium F08102]|nr:Gldg family protein [Flavobacteriaceae bacterium F08102]
MKLIYKIAKTELNIMFYSPIAWLVLVIFIVQGGISFIDSIGGLVSYSQQGNSLSYITSSIFSRPYGSSLFVTMMKNLYLYIPLLTMGLLSKEFSTGSFKLLLSSPIKFRTIVLGKFLSIAIYGLILVLILLLFVVIASFLIPNLEWGLIFSGLLGLYLLICAYSAIGLFISSLTSYQVVAAIGTLTVLAFFNFIGSLWQDIPYVNEVTYWLSISGRTEQMIEGLISSKVLMYFFLVIAFFLIITILKLSSGKQNRSIGMNISLFSGLIFALIFIGYVSSRPSLIAYQDMTSTNRLTLNEESQKIVSQLKDAPLKITSYVNIFSSNAPRSGLPKNQNGDFRYFEKYVRFLPKLEFNYVYFYDTIPSNPDIYIKNPGLSEKELAKKISNSYGLNFENVLSPEEIKSKIDLSTEENQYVRQLTYKDRRVFLRMFNDMTHYPNDTQIMAAFKGLVDDHTQIGLITGQGERAIFKNDMDYRTIISGREDSRGSLLNKGFSYSFVDLKENISDNIDILVIADPTSSYSESEISFIKEYIDAGRNLFILSEPNNDEAIEPVLNILGVEYEKGQLYQENEDFSNEFIIAKLEEGTPKFLENMYLRSLMSYDYNLSMPNSKSLKLKSNADFLMKPLVFADSENTILKPYIDSDSITDTSIKHITGAALLRTISGNEQKIAIFGDADFMSNKELTRRNIRILNDAFSSSIFTWLGDFKYPVKTGHPRPEDNVLNVSESGVQFLRVFIFGFLPIMVILFSIILLIRRKRK